MISQEKLDTRMERVDALVDTILDCQLFLDEMFAVSDAPASSPIPREAATPLTEKEIARNTAARIKKERAARGWRQQDLSEVTGIARPNIARLEGGKRMPKLSTLQKIAAAMGLRIEELME